MSPVAKGVSFPIEYKQFILEFGGGYFGFVKIYSLDADSSFYLMANQNAVPDGYLAISDNDCGDYYVLKNNSGIIGSKVLFYDHELQEIVETNYENIYEKKYQALESFYGWVDQGSDYNIAVEQSIYYDHNMEEIDEIIFNIIVATRFCRSGRKISEEFQNRLGDMIIKAKELEWQKYGLSDEEIEEFNEEIEEAESLLF